MVQGTLDWNRLPSDDMMIPAQGKKQKEGKHNGDVKICLTRV